MEGALPYISFMLALGFLLGAVGLVMWMISRLRGKDRTPAAQETAIPRQPPQPVEETADQQPPSPVLRTEEGRQLLSVLRTEAGEPIIQVHGLYYRHLREITDVGAREDALAAIRAILSFAEIRSAPVQSSVEEAFLQQLQQLQQHPDRAAGTPGTLAPLVTGGSMLLNAMDRSIREMVSPSLPEPSLLTPAEQIDRLVQQRLQERPELKRHGIIRVSTGRDGGLRFHVGLRSYQAVDEIAEADVRAVMEEAIREWRESLGE